MATGDKGQSRAGDQRSGEERQTQEAVATRDAGLDLKTIESDQQRRADLARQQQDEARQRQEDQPANPATMLTQTVTGPGVPDAATMRAERSRAMIDQASRPRAPLTEDNSTATATAAVARDVKGPAPFAPADPLRPSQTLLVRSRQNGVFEGPEYQLGTADQPWTGEAVAFVYNLFGGPDRDVALRLRLQSRPDASVPWEEANVFELGELREAGENRVGVQLVGPTRVVGAVVGSAGGHAVEVEVTVSKG
jgi:hypothetical protein